MSGETKNRGTGAGGAQTNKSGKKLENRVRNIYTIKMKIMKVIRGGKKRAFNLLHIKIRNKILIRAAETAFKLFDQEYKKRRGETWDSEAWKNQTLGGTQEPDDAYIDEKNKVLYWLECKVQNGTGSVNEKLQTYNQKIRNLRERYPDYQIKYIYVLDKNFRNLSPTEIKYMKEDGIAIIWDDDEHFEDSLLAAIGV